MKLLFVNPFFLKDSALEQRWMTPYFPLGLLYLAASAREAGHQVAVFDGTFQPGEAAFRAALRLHQPDVVCIASLITLRACALRLAALAAASGAHVLFGGPDPSSDPAAYLEHGALVVLGEGERTLADVLGMLETGGDLGQVRGIARRGAAGIVTTPVPEPIWDLDALPFPARDLIDVAPYLAAWQQAHGYRSLTLAASRGCPYGCEHCTAAGRGAHWRVRRPENVAREMQAIEAAYAPDCFRLVDDLEGLGRDWLIALGQAMLAAGVQTPYEGLKPLPMGALPMYAPLQDLCAERNRWLPTADAHPHAPPALDPAAIARRWQSAVLTDDERLEDP